MSKLYFLFFIAYSVNVVGQSAISEYKRISVYNNDGTRVDVIDENIPRGKINEHAIGIVIGNREYQNGISKVDFAVSDAKLVSKYFKEMFGIQQENIIYLEDASLSKMKVVFGDKDNYKGQLYDKIIADQSELYFFYSGHGAPDPNDQQAYLMPVDADPNHLPLTGYRLETLYSNISAMPLKKAVLIIDACFSGTASNGEQLIKYASPVGIKVKKPQLMNYDKRVIITAAGNNQIASWYPQKQHGLLTYQFLLGLRGEADFDKNKKIDVKELRTWLTDKSYGVPGIARRIFSRDQNPEVEGNDDFIIK
jgi:hypothetical protein